MTFPSTSRRGIKRGTVPDTSTRKRGRAANAPDKLNENLSSRSRRKVVRKQEVLSVSKPNPYDDNSEPILEHRKPSRTKRPNQSKKASNDEGIHTRSGRVIPKLLNEKSHAKLSQCNTGNGPSPEVEDEESTTYYGTDIRQVSAERAKLLDPNEGRCIITGRTDDLRPCCVLPRSTSDAKVVTLEKSWGYDRNSLHAEAQCNIMFLHQSVYEAYQANEWMLLPDIKVIEILREHFRDHLGRPININTVYQPDDDRTRFRYHAVPTFQCKTPQLFEGLAAITSHILPHHAIVRSGEVQGIGWDYRSDDVIANTLVKTLGYDRADSRAWLEKIDDLARTWLHKVDAYEHRSAPRWLDLQSTIQDDARSLLGRHRPCPDSTCGWWSEDNPISSRSGDEAEDDQPRPRLVSEHFDRDLWISQWVNASQMTKHKRSYGILPAIEAKRSSSDQLLCDYRLLPCPRSLETFDWKTTTWPLPQFDSGELDYELFCTIDWALYHAECQLWL